MRKRLSLLVAVLAACAAPKPQPPRGEEALRVDGQVENAPFRFGVEDLPTLPRRAFETADATGRGAGRRYEGVAIDAVLADHMELKRDADTAVVHGERGLAVPVPLSLLRQLQPVLADARATDGETRRDAPGSLLLAWPVTDHPGIETDARFRWWWVPGVRRVEIASWVDTYGRALQVPAGASGEARLGADLLGAQCMGCHAVRGVGGTRGPSLTDGASGARLRRHPGALGGHLREVSGSAAAPTITATMASHVAAFLEAVRVAGPGRAPPDQRDRDAASPPPGEDEPPVPPPPGAGPPGGEPPIGGSPTGR